MYIHNYVYIVKAVVFSFGFECKHNNPSVKPSNTKKKTSTQSTVTMTISYGSGQRSAFFPSKIFIERKLVFGRAYC